MHNFIEGIKRRNYDEIVQFEDFDPWILLDTWIHLDFDPWN